MEPYRARGKSIISDFPTIGKPKVLGIEHPRLGGRSLDVLIVDDITEQTPEHYRKTAYKWFMGWDLAKGPTMQKFAPVAPIHIYEALANRGYVPDNILLLAHDVVKTQNVDRYLALFNRGAWKNTHIIMDNSLIELQTAVDVTMVKEAVDIVGANVVILPDSLTDGIESAELTLKTFDTFKTAFSQPYRGDEKVELMAVIQGETMSGFMGALHRLEAIAEYIEWISIPRRTDSKFGYNRMELIDFAKPFFPDHKIHLLGFSDQPWNDIIAAQLSDVISIDSAAPLRVENGYVMAETGGPRVITDSKGNKTDWWDVVEYEDFMLSNIRKVDALINQR